MYDRNRSVLHVHKRFYVAVVEDGMIILKLTYEKCILTVRVRFNRLRIGSKVTVCQHGNEPTHFIGNRKFLN
jgi:hypothetical protein